LRLPEVIIICCRTERVVGNSLSDFCGLIVDRQKEYSEEKTWIVRPPDFFNPPPQDVKTKFPDRSRRFLAICEQKNCADALDMDLTLRLPTDPKTPSLDDDDDGE
jgi:hypothetical protein